jgi:DNA-binding transcriptional LysR family regulator
VELAHLDTFLSVYRSGNITAAAKKLFLSQPAVTSHIKALESELGSPLFVRLARGVSPTDLAHRLAEEITTPLDAIHHSIGRFNPAAPQTEATCMIGGPSDALAELVLPALAPMIAEGLRVDVRIGLTNPLLDALTDGELDLVVATTPARRRNVVSETLCSETLQLVGPANMGATPPSDLLVMLHSRKMLAYADNAPLVRRYFRERFPNETPPTPAVTVADLRALRSLVIGGAGWTVLPDYIAAPALGDGSLVILERPDPAPTNQLYLATRASRRHHPSIAAVHAAIFSKLASQATPNAAPPPLFS